MFAESIRRRVNCLELRFFYFVLIAFEDVKKKNRSVNHTNEIDWLNEGKVEL